MFIYPVSLSALSKYTGSSSSPISKHIPIHMYWNALYLTLLPHTILSMGFPIVKHRGNGFS